MGHILGQFLSSSGPFFDQLIADLEKSTRHQSFDVDLVGELMTQVNGQLRQLGLIPGDILADEIRQALIAQYQQNQHEVAYQVFGESSDPKVRQHKLEIKLRQLFQDKVLSIDDKVLIKIIKNCPPTKTKKALGLKNTDSLFKKFSPAEIIYFASKLESDGWHDKLVKHIAELTPADFSFKKVKVVFLDTKTLTKLKLDAGLRLEQQYLVGGLFIHLPLNAMLDLQALDFILEAVDEYQKLIDYDNQMQVFTSSTKFDQIIKSIAANQPVHVWNVLGNPLPWRSIYRILANPQSHLHQLDRSSSLKLVDFRPIDLLVRQFKQLDFWVANSRLAFKDQHHIISLNIFDVYQLIKTGYDYKAHFEDELWDELLSRYLADDNLASQIMLQLNNKIRT